VPFLWFPLALLTWQSPEPAVLRTETRIVQINVSVKDKNDDPILGLQADDFTVFDNGQPRRVQLLSSDVSSAPKPEGPASRLTVLVLDGLNTEFMDQNFVRDQARKAVKHMDLNEVFAVLALNPDLKFQNFTRRRDLLLKAVEAFRPIDPPYAMRQRVQVTLQALKTLADNMSGAPGIKSIVWITGGFPQIHSFNAAIRRSLDRINEANVALYPIDARGLMLNTGLLNDRTMDQFADATGGEAFYNRNDVSALIERAANASRSAYLLGFYLTDNDRDHSPHRLEVKVNRPHAELHYRRSYSIPR